MLHLLTRVLLCSLLTQVAINSAHAQRISEEQAAQDTYIEGLRLVDYWAQPAYLTSLDIHLGYVEKDTQLGGGRHHCSAISSEQSQLVAETISTALSQVAADSLKKLKLKYLILCGRLLAGEQGVGGFAVPPLDLLVIATANGINNPTNLRKTVLHELYHFIEDRFQTSQDGEWQKRFGSGYANSYSGRMTASEIGQGKPGFVNRYGETYPHEERAELFTALLLKPTVLAAHIEATDDRLLKEKALYMIEKCERLIDLRIAVSGISY